MGATYYGLVFAGLSSLGLGIFHLPGIWSAVFRHWNDDMSGARLLTRKLINTVLIALCLAVAALGAMTLMMASDLVLLDSHELTFLFFCFLFWLWRLIWQVLYFPYRKLNPGKKLLALHLALIAIFAANTLAYLVPVIATLLS